MRMSDWSSDGCSSDLAVRLLEVGAAGFFEPLDAAGGIGQADFGELRVDGAPAALEDAEDVAGRHDVPARQRIEPCKRAALRLAVGDRKSTRLNPVIMRISYAVFCLKKKKQEVTKIYRTHPCSNTRYK